MTSEFKGAKVEIGDVFYYKEHSIILDKPEIVTVIEIASNNSEASYENYGVKLKSPYDYDYGSFAVDDLTRLGDDKLTYIGNKYTDKFIEVSDVTGEVIGEIKIGTPFSKENHIEPENEKNIGVHDDVEAVAFFNRFKNKTSNVTQYKVVNNAMLLSSEPLYTVDQLNPRVKMTRSKFKEIIDITMGINLLGIYGAFKKVFEESERYPNLYKSFETNQGQIEFSKILDNFDREQPEKTIEIIPEKKWFVRSKERNSEKNYYYFVGKIPQDLFILYGYKKAAKQFDTKEEAERWTNPDTEAVYLPVEEK